MAFLGFGKKEEAIQEPEILPVFPQEIYEAGVLELQDVIAPSALEIQSGHIKLGEKMTRTLFVISYPRYLGVNWFSPVINLDKVFDVSIFVHPTDTATVLRQLQKKVTEVASQIHMREEKGLVRDPLLDTAYRDLETLRDNLQQAQEKLFSFALYLTIYGSTLEELNKTETEIRSLLESKLVYAKPALFQQGQGLESVFPFCSDKLDITAKLNSSPVSSLFPFVSFDLTSNKGILYGINRHNSSLVLFDRFSLENYNSVVFGKAGGGKSILGSEPVLIKRGGEIQLTTIGSLVEKTIKERGITKLDEEMEGVILPGFEVYSFNKDLKGEWSAVTVAARKKAPGDLYRFTTRSGREITTTEDHNMVILKNGTVAAEKSSEVKRGSFIPLPRSVRTNENPPRFLNLLRVVKNHTRLYVRGAEKIIRTHYSALKNSRIDARYDSYLYKYRDGRRIPLRYFRDILNFLKTAPEELPFSSYTIVSKSGKGSLALQFPITKEFLKILGYITAEGTITKTSILISNRDPEVLKDITRALRQIKVLSFETDQGIVIAERPFLELVTSLMGRRHSAEKQVPRFIYSLGKENIASYLAAYFEGDGGVEHSSISAVSKSEKLISQIAYLLFYFGIVARIRPRKKKVPTTARKRTYWLLSISGQEYLKKFSEEICFVSGRKNARLKCILKQEGNTNVDIVPEIKSTAEELWQLFSPQLQNIPELSELRACKRNFSPRRLQNVIQKIEERVEKFEALKESFQTLANLPTLEAILRLVKTDKKLNHAAWQALGSSWPIMKHQRFHPRARSVFKLMEVASMENILPSLSQIKTLLHTGFKETGAEVTYFNPSLQVALAGRRESNTSYQMLQEAAAFIWQRYQELEVNLPRINGLLGQLKLLASSELFWDRIVKIEKIQNAKEKYVYDLTVNNEVFLAGRGGMFIHNSYAIKLEILRSLMFDTEVIVIDPEREYEYLTEAVDGRYFNISLTSHHHINPFDLPPPREDESPADVLRSNIVNLVGLFRILLGGLTPEEDAILDSAIVETYASRDITPESDFTKIPPPILSDLELVLANMEGGGSLAQRLRKYTQGAWAGFINQPTNIDINKKLVVFSVRDMEDELRPIAIYLIVHRVWNAIRHELKKRVLVVDEAWWLMKTEDGASFLYGIAKRARKYYLGLVTVTQDVGDFLNSPYGKAIITNSSLQLLLKQSPATIDVLQQTFGLTDEEKFLLLESDIGEGIFFAGLKHVAIKTLSSYMEDQIITSDPAQLFEIKKAKEEYEKANS